MRIKLVDVKMWIATRRRRFTCWWRGYHALVKSESVWINGVKGHGKFCMNCDWRQHTHARTLNKKYGEM